MRNVITVLTGVVCQQRAWKEEDNTILRLSTQRCILIISANGSFFILFGARPQSRALLAQKFVVHGEPQIMQELNLHRTNCDDASKPQYSGFVLGFKVISWEVDVLTYQVRTASGITLSHKFIGYLIVPSVELRLMQMPRLFFTSPVRSDCM